MRPLVFLLLPLLLLASCSSSSDEGTAQPEPTSWQACPGYLGGDVECASFRLPLTYSEAPAETIQGTVFRTLGASAVKKGQIWFLQGGPGESNAVFARLFSALRTQHPGWDFYSLEHRGVGNSTRLTCPSNNYSEVTSANAAQCVSELEARWGKNLADFSTTNAARDLNLVVEKLREPGKELFFYGASYGTLWLHRYLQLYPGKATGFIFDSICPADVCALDGFDSNLNDASKQVMDLCAAEPACQQRLSSVDPDTWKAMQVVYERMDAGTICDGLKPLVTRERLRKKLAELVEGLYARALVPAVVYRVNRCSQGDVAAIEHLMRAAPVADPAAPLADEQKLYSSELYANVALSELWRGTSVADEQKVVETLYASEDRALELAKIAALAAFPAYTDEYIGKWTSSNAPMLMMNSTIDGLTPLRWGEAFADHFKGEQQYFVKLPSAAHGAAFSLPMADDLESKRETCGSKIMFGFLENTRTAPDASCLDKAFKLGFDPSSPQAQLAAAFYFGTSSLWD